MKSKLQNRFRMGLAGAAMFAGLGGLLSLGAAAVQSTPAGATNPPAATTGDSYNPVTPLRVTDTRAGSGQENAGKTIGTGGVLTVSVPVAAVGGLTDVDALTLNVTAVDATASSYFTVYPTGDTSTNFSDLNFYPGFAQPNLVTTPVFYNSTTQAYTFEIFNYAGTADAVVDLEGYYSPTPGSAYYPLTPVRITDTRSTSTPVQANAGKTIPADGILTIQVTGSNGVPAGATAAVLNVTATNTTAASYFTVYPGPGIPVASNVNWLAGETIPNRVTVQLSSTGTVSIYNYAGSADAVVDLDGYFANPTTTSPGNLFVPLAPSRITDTRSTSVPAQPNAGKTLTAGGTLVTQVTGAGDVPISTPGAPITAALLNVTAATATAGSYLTVYPSTAAAPNASDLNFGPGFVVANNDPVAVSPSGVVNIYNYAGNTDVVVDVFGYYIPTLGATSTVTLTPASTTVAPGDLTTVTVTTLEGGLPAADTAVALVDNGSPTAACGTGVPSTVTTDSAGTFTFTYLASETTGTCFIAAEEGAPSYASTLTSIQTSTAAPSITLTPTSSSVVHDGTTSVSVHTSNDGSPVSEPVAFAVTGSVAGACAAAPAAVTTSAAGTATFTYTAGTTAGTCVITAEDSDTATTVTSIATT